jgi:NAD(P)H dehydrogenase (quinone)
LLPYVVPMDGAIDNEKRMIVVTGATGKLGRHVIEVLLKKVPAGKIVAAVRSPKNAADLAALGVVVRAADYAKPDTLTSAFAGAEKVLLISSNALGAREEQHKAVIRAAAEAKVKLLAYTSVLRAETSKLILAKEHLATEALIRESGLPFAFLRNGWYLENNTEALGPALEHGVILGASADGRFSSAARADYAGAAAEVLTAAGHENKVYELAGETSFSKAELAATVSRLSGKTVIYKNLSESEYAGALAGFGLPAELTEMLADSDEQASKGELESDSQDLRTLIGRPTMTLEEAVKTALK